MAFTLLVIVAAIVVGYLRGGRLHRIADSQLRWPGLLFAGFGLQVALDLAAPRYEGLEGVAGTAVLVASHLLVLGWIAANRYRPGMALVFAGLAMNAVVIAANGGMPVDPQAITRLGIEAPEALYGKHVLMTESTRLAFLADIYALPPLRTIISVGDVVLAAGLVPLVGHLMTYRSPVERRGGEREGSWIKRI